MRIVIDLQGAQTASRFRGIGRYTMALTRGILRNAGPHEIWVVLNGALEESVAQVRADLAGLVPHERIRVFEPPGHIAEMDAHAAPLRQAAEMLREQFIAMLAPDMVLVTSLFEGFLDDAVGSVGTFIDGARTAVILYDLIPLLNPSTYLASPYLRQCYMRKIDSLKRAGLLLSISDYTRQEAIDELGLQPGHVVSISTAVDETFAPGALQSAELDAVRRRFGITRFMLMCAPGGYDPRKNIAGLVKAYGLLPPSIRETHQLVIASRLTEADRQTLLAHAAASGLAASDLILTGYVGDADLIALYQAATLFVFPSLHEGFGLPVLEAMACGTPTIASNLTSLPEVIGLDEALFDPADPQSIADRIAEVLGDPILYERLRCHSRRQASKFSWDETARRALRALERHHATADAVPARPHAALMQMLAAVPDLPGDEQTLLQLASCFAALPDPAAPPQLLLDLGTLACDGLDTTPGSEAAAAWLGSPVAGRRVVSIALELRRDVWHYRQAPLPGTTAAGRVADIRTGDRLLVHAGAADTRAAAHADGLYAHLHRLGVEFHLVFDDIPGTDAGEWLGALLEYASRVVCTSQAVARSLENWWATQGLQRPLPPVEVIPQARLCPGTPHDSALTAGGA